MIILDKKIAVSELEKLNSPSIFYDMVKAVVDIGLERIALSAELHSDLEELLLENGSEQKNLYGINIYFGTGEIEFDSMINPPRNRDAGYPRGGRDVKDPIARDKIKKVVEKWITL